MVKTCANCGRRITAAEWRKLPVVGYLCMPADSTGPEEHREYRNCPCRSTLLVPVKPDHAGKCTVRKAARDPMTPREARARAKTMFRELAKVPPRLPSGQDNPELFERAAVLADVVLETDRPDVGEVLALAVQGRVTPYSVRFLHMGIGAQLPPGTEVAELANAILIAERSFFPPRRGPCMPNAKELRRLVENEHGTAREATSQLRRLNAALREACGYSSYSTQYLENVMNVANDVLGGHGVERAVYEILAPRRGGHVADFHYVNMGDAYAATLFHRDHRFFISTWGDEVERVERRYGEGGIWRT